MALNKQHQPETSPSSVSVEEPIQFDTLPHLTKRNLYNLADAVKDVVPFEQKSWIIRTSELPSYPVVPKVVPKIINKVSNWARNGSKFLYYLQVMGQPDLNAIRKAYSESRKRDRGTRAYARLRKRSPSSTPITEKPSPYFYVGSSSNISSRLNDHLGYGTYTTFALQLAHWAVGLDLKLKFTCAKYQNSGQADVFQALEDTLWDQLQPMFGRKGRR
jgi:hypothetical protein